MKKTTILAALLALVALTGEAKVEVWKSIEELCRDYPYTVPEDWFRTDTVTIRGRIEGYDAERFGFTSLDCYLYDVFAMEEGVTILDIAKDGSFECRFPLSYPMRNMFYHSESMVQLSEIPFYACPGDTIDIAVRPDEDGRYRCHYNSGSSKEVERWLHADLMIQELCRPIWKAKKEKVADAKRIAERVWQDMLCRIGETARRDGFTPLEVHLALAHAQTEFANAWTNYLMYHAIETVNLTPEEGYATFAPADTAEWSAIVSASAYTPLHRIDFDNPLLLVNSEYHFLLDHFLSADAWQQDEDTAEVCRTAFESVVAGYETMRALIAADHDNLAAQLCTYQRMLNHFFIWLENEATVIPQVMATFSHPYIREKAELYCARQMAQTEIASPLPEGNSAADLIRSVAERYPGRYLYIDFWGLGCGPCCAEIQGSKEQRAEIAGRDDVKLVFITQERTAEGSEAYRKYVAEWLADEEAICVSDADFRRLQELFQFTGIPHHETITPDGRRVRADYGIAGYSNIDYYVQRLKQKLGK